MAERSPAPLPLIALTLGDPAGIGPEVCLAALADWDLAGELRILALGPRRLRPGSVELLDGIGDLAPPRRGHGWLDTGEEGGWEVGRPQASAGRAALGALRRGADLAGEGRVDALVTAPVAKEALHLAGERVEGQTELLARWAGVERVGMLAIARELRVLLLTRHLPLRTALARVTTEGVVEHLRLLNDGLSHLGFERPRLALAGLNPHAGEGGLFGGEERDRLEPAVEAARAEGIDVTGPLPPDTVFLRASRGAFDAVLALYHDQAFISVKLHAPGEGLTVLLGLPYLRVSPVHGTAFDIAGTGRADPRNLIAALRQAAAWVRQSDPARSRAHAAARPARGWPSPSARP